MLETAYFIIGFAVFWYIVGLLAHYLIVPLAAALSLALLQVICVFRAGKWREARWRGLPKDFLRQWWEFTLYGHAGTTISSPRYTWSGIFRWEFH